MFIVDGIIALLIILVIIWVAVNMEMSMINEFKDISEKRIQEKSVYETLKSERYEGKWILAFIGSID
ncbi:MAG: hypothetical protein JXA43_02155 [Candidatus Diapherotrites archaeon]|nr:hypothetical protein [Candidatus Diapherotrites archaeon]